MELDSEESIDISNVSYEGLDETIDRMIVEAIVITHRLENYITESFIFAVGNKRYNNYSIKEVIKYWKEKFTFGKLINLMKEQFDIDETIENSLSLFLYQRNKIAPVLTKEERFDIDTLWGKKELAGFLMLFLKNSYELEKIIRSAYTVTMALLFSIMENVPNKSTKKLKGVIKEIYANPCIQDELDLFNGVFHIKNNFEEK